MKRNWIRKIVGGLSLTSVLFVFQACYGTPQDFGLDLFVEGQVKSGSTGLPIPGILVSVGHSGQCEWTDEEGKFSLYTEKMEKITLHFQDIDSIQNGHYNSKETVLNVLSENLYINIALEEK